MGNTAGPQLDAALFATTLSPIIHTVLHPTDQRSSLSPIRAGQLVQKVSARNRIKSLIKSRKIVLTVFPSLTRWVTLSYKDMRLGRTSGAGLQ